MTELSASRNNRMILMIAVVLFGVFVAGCGPEPFTSKPVETPEIVYCFDTVGHSAGATPFLLGGTCCCTPGERVLADWQKNGHFIGKTVNDVIDMYHEAGIQLACDHQHCNNACPGGPHVVKGGRCMVPPTPGTENYEEVLFGQVYMVKKRAPKEYRKVVPSSTVSYTQASSAESKK